MTEKVPTSFAPTPFWVAFDNPRTSEIDILGLRYPVQALAADLVPGITVATGHVRYLSLRSWLIWSYIHRQPRPVDRLKPFTEDFATQAEAAFVMGNLLVDRTAQGLVGQIRGTEVLEKDGPLKLESLAKVPAVNIYRGVCETIGLTRIRDPGLPALVGQRGLVLAEALGASVAETALGQKIGAGVCPPEATKEELLEFGRVVSSGGISEGELDALSRILAPVGARDRDSLGTFPGDHARSVILAILLFLAPDAAEESTSTSGTAAPEADGSGPRDAGLTRPHLAVMKEAVSAVRSTPPVFDEILDGWLMYGIRDAMAVTGEATLEALGRHVRRLGTDGGGVPAHDVLSALVGEGGNQQVSVFREFGLLPSTAGAKALSSVTVKHCMDELSRLSPLGPGPRGLRRWTTGVFETDLIARGRNADDGAVALGLLSLLLAVHRVGTEEDELPDFLAPLSVHGGQRLGLRQVILPTFRGWVQRETTLSEALWDYASIIIEQHQRVAWSRLATSEPTDIHVFTRDAGHLIPKKKFAGGQTNPRTDFAWDWLGQMGLARDGHTTRQGRELLARVRGALEAEPPPGDPLGIVAPASAVEGGAVSAATT